MTYIEKNRGNHGKKIVFVIVGFIISIYFLVQFLFPHFLPALFTSIAVPFWRAQFSIESGSLLSSLSLLRENEELKRELLLNSTKMTTVEYLDLENAQLRKLLHSTSSKQYILSAILKRPPLYPYDELIIDIGSDRNISTTSIVYAEGDIPIGRVTDVFGKSSKVILFSSPGEKNEVLIGDKNILAEANGVGGGQFEVELPKGAIVNVGDFVVLATLDSRPFGKVVSVDTSSSLPFQKVLFSVPINLYQLRWVLIFNQDE